METPRVRALTKYANVKTGKFRLKPAPLSSVIELGEIHRDRLGLHLLVAG